jgi:hypothetical protein
MSNAGGVNLTRPLTADYELVPQRYLRFPRGLIGGIHGYVGPVALYRVLH